MTRNDVRFVAHVGDPFGVVPFVLVGSDANGDASEIDIEDLSHEQRVVITYDLRTLLDALQAKGLTIPATVIEIRDALRLISGLSRAQGGEKSWDWWSYLSPAVMPRETAEALKNVIEAKVPQPNHQDLVQILMATVNALGHVWEVTVRELVNRGEYERFLQIEIPVRQIFNYRQESGIEVNTSIATRLIAQASELKYRAFRTLASMLGYSPAGLTFLNVGNHLSKTDAADLCEFGESEQLEQYFKLAREQSLFADTFLNYIKAGRMLSVLRTIDLGPGRTRPAFDCIGTVTARILVVDPRLQQLPKEFRRLLGADSGKRLWYFDYAQFEPGVLAELMGDSDFRSLYHSADVYASLSTAVFGTPEKRDLCKSVFLAYCYGMSAERIAALLGMKLGKNRESYIRAAISEFFSAFPALEHFKKEMQDHLERQGWVSTLLGNRRYRTSRGLLFEAEKRWALNQAVQGTASLIFKQALIDLAGRFGIESIVLPMHDGIVMQFPEGEQPEENVIDVMIASFRRWCPNVNPRVASGDFA